MTRFRRVPFDVEPTRPSTASPPLLFVQALRRRLTLDRRQPGPIHCAAIMSKGTLLCGCGCGCTAYPARPVPISCGRSCSNAKPWWPATRDAARLPASGAVREQVDAHLATLVHDVDGLMSVVVASLDDFAMAQVGREEETANRLAAMTSSMLALAQALGRERVIGSLGALILDAAHGKVLMLTIPVQPPHLLMAACDQTGAMGQVLWHVKQCVRLLAAAMPAGTPTR